MRIARGLSVLTLAVATLVLGAITYKQASGCAMHLTGGTETGHATSTYSHWNGYKLDFSLNSCLDNHITTNWAALGGDKWEAPSGNVYYRERTTGTSLTTPVAAEGTTTTPTAGAEATTATGR